jgi:predicted trehalose synthase
MQAALSPVLEIGPAFLAGRLDADAMATTMVRAVQQYSDGERTRQQAGPRPADDLVSTSTAVEELHAALAEIYTCGTGYLADRCDADCVARTMAEIMREFGDLAPAR